MKRRLGRVDWTIFGPHPVIGVDEVGRGSMAGPVVAAAVILSYSKKKSLFQDSKLLTEVRREELFAIIQRDHRWSVGFASVAEIEKVNVHHASLMAMRRAVEGLKLEVLQGHLLVDGKFKIPGLSTTFCQTPLVKGDRRAQPVAAASIVAKVTRDRHMKTLAEEFPEYGFEVHKGYATAHHFDMLAALGPCEHHRRGFRGVVSEGESLLEG